MARSGYAGERLDTRSDDRRSELRRDRFGFVFQSGQLVPELTAEENVYASPALIALLRGVPAGQLAARFPGRLADAIGDAAALA